MRALKSASFAAQRADVLRTAASADKGKSDARTVDSAQARSIHRRREIDSHM
jgi:hypothetical protein